MTAIIKIMEIVEVEMMEKSSREDSPLHATTYSPTINVHLILTKKFLIY